jgi:hypothetical protein
VENRFQSLPFKCNLQRYSAGGGAAAERDQGAADARADARQHVAAPVMGDARM